MGGLFLKLLVLKDLELVKLVDQGKKGQNAEQHHQDDGTAKDALFFVPVLLGMMPARLRAPRSIFGQSSPPCQVKRGMQETLFLASPS